MARLQTREAKALLRDIAIQYGVPPLLLLLRYRYKHAMAAKRAFITEAAMRHIPILTIAAVLRLHHSTVLHHASPAMRERKRSQERQRRATAKGQNRCEA